MKVVVAAGGTGGHLYPALALVDYIKQQQPDSTFLFIGTKDRLESQVVPNLGYNYVGLNVKGLVGNPLKKAYAAMLFVKSISAAKKEIKKFNPDIVIGFGGYPSASAIEAAFGLKIKTLIHEQNSIIGLTNKILIKKVDKIVCCYQKAYNDFPKEKTLLLGNPRASVITHEIPREIHDKYHLDKNKKLVTIVMGSLGSKSVNDTMIDAMDKFKDKNYQVLYVTGKPYYESMKQYENENVKIVPYIDDMPSVMHATDLIISRAGASTLAELTALGVPAILIPSPYVASNHQEYNALELVHAHAAQMILEKDLEVNHLIHTIDSIIEDDTTLNVLKENARKLGKPNACQDMYDVIIEMLGE
ncbi:MAG: undecaprenyldiphospho-muramoylpentapeptide beta-N-acetylglucosaminyltransferase [Faecalibacillus sp.]